MVEIQRSMLQIYELAKIGVNVVCYYNKIDVPAHQVQQHDEVLRHLR